MPPSLACLDLHLVGGAYDGLSASLVERAGFDAIWASGFSISASKCLPDCNVMTIADLVSRVSEMTRAVTIPVFVDCDEGYGELSCTVDLAGQLTACGAAGICIEDSRYPKLNSFYGEPGRRLLDALSYSRKLLAIRKHLPRIPLIARTESLIAGESLETALARGMQYAESGADFVLIHSRYTSRVEFESLAKAWTGSVPLVVIPTLAESMSWRDLLRMGFAMVIYANQALRASVDAQERVLSKIRDFSGASRGASLAPMQHIFDLTNLQAKSIV
jgi:phosphoenolpyruvate phosphomutase